MTPADRDPHRSRTQLQRSKDEIINVRAEAARSRTPLQRALVRVARAISHPWFFAAELALHTGWVVMNTGWVPGISPWDPYPFGLLAGLASVQALFIGLLILMYAEQESRMGEVREEMELQVALHDERETSKVLRMLTEIQDALGIHGAERDRELELMSKPIDPEQLREVTRQHIEEADEP